MPDEQAPDSYYRWYYSLAECFPEDDVWLTEISNDGGNFWTHVEIIGPNGPEVRGGWFQATFRIGDFLNPTTAMRVRFTAADEGVGAIIEGGVDGFKVSRVRDDTPFIPGDTSQNGVIDLLDIAPVRESDCVGNIPG